MQDFDRHMTAEDQADHSAAFSTIDIGTRDGRLMLAFRRVNVDGEEVDADPKPPVRMVFSFGQAMALMKALGLGLAILVLERRRTSIKEPGRMW